MSTKKERHQLFKEILDSLPISQGDLANWFYQENTKQTRKYVSRKATGANPVSKTEIDFLQTLKFLHEKGFDLKSVEFSEEGKMLELSKL